MTHFGWGGERDYDPHTEPEYYTADDGDIVLAHEGELEAANPDEYMPPMLDLGGGIYLRIHPEYFRMIMHTPEITAAVEERCDELAAEANSLKVREDAEYIYEVSNNTENIRARGRVKPANVEAILDDAENSTLLKALSTVGSDPLPPQYFQSSEGYNAYLADHGEFPGTHAEYEADRAAAVAAGPEGTEGGSYMGGDNG